MTAKESLIWNSFETARVTYRKPEPSDIDELGHVNNVVYVRWVQDAAVEHWMHVVPSDKADKFVWVCSRHEIDYRSQLLLEDEIEVRTWLGDYKGARFDRHVAILKKGTDRPAVQAKTTWVLMSRETFRPQRIREDILSLFGKA